MIRVGMKRNHTHLNLQRVVTVRKVRHTRGRESTRWERHTIRNTLRDMRV